MKNTNRKNHYALGSRRGGKVQSGEVTTKAWKVCPKCAYDNIKAGDKCPRCEVAK